ncbi:MAG: hypothetical protein AJITA_00665 [Acetilactobacillus jinshanensis]
MDPKDLTKLTEQEHFMLDAGVYLVFLHANDLDHLSRIKIDSANHDIDWQLTTGQSVHYQVTYNHNHTLNSMMNTFVAESIDKKKHLLSTNDRYVYFTNLSFPLGKSYQNPEQFKKGSHITLYSKNMNDDQKNTILKQFKNSPLNPKTKGFKKFFAYFWKRFVIEQPQFNEADDISRNNELMSRLLKTLQNKYVVSDNDLLVLAKLLGPVRRILNCNLWANNFDYQHHVYVPGSRIQAILTPSLSQLKRK